MAITASANFRTEFDTLVKHDFQAGSKLSGKFRTRTDINAKTHKFPKLGKGIATPRVPQTDVVPMNVVHDVATVTLTDWAAPEYSDILDLDKLPFDEKMELVKTSQMAIGRRLDQMIIDAMVASAFATQVGSAIGGANTSLNVEKIVRANRLLTANGVPMEGRCMIINAAALEGALLESEVGSSDFNVMKALAMGEVKTFAGFEFIVIEDRANEGGLPISSNERNCFAAHRDAVGVAISTDIFTNVEYIAEKTSHLINTLFSAGAVTVDTDGVIDVLTYEA